MSHLTSETTETKPSIATATTPITRSRAARLQSTTIDQKDEEIQELRMMVEQLEIERANMVKKLHKVKVKEEKHHDDVVDTLSTAAGRNAHREAGALDVVDGGVGSGNVSSDDDDEVMYGSDVEEVEAPIVLPKIPHSLKTFSGLSGSSVRTWLQQYDTIRLPFHWSDRVSVAVCAMHLTDRAQQWYTDEGRKKSVSRSWSTFKKALLNRFTPTVNQLFIPKYTQNCSQRMGEKSVDFLDRVRTELRDLGVDNEEWVVRVFSSGLHDWIMEPLTMLVGKDYKISAKELVDHCTRIELSKAIRHGTHFDQHRRNGVGDGGGYNKPMMKNYMNDHPRKRDAGPIQGYAKIGGMVTSNEKLQLSRNNQCRLCGDSGHWAKECPKRQGMRPGGVNVAVNVGNGKVCSHCGKNGHLVDDCYTLKNEQKRKEGAYPPRGGNGAPPPGRAAIRSVQVQEQGQHSVRTLSMAVNSVKHAEAGVFSVQVWVGGRKTIATLDSGADQVSCLNDDHFQWMAAMGLGRWKLEQNPERLVSAGGASLECRGTIILPVRMLSTGGWKEMDVCFHVVKGLNVPCLLGSNFFLMCTTRLDWEVLDEAYMLLWTKDKVYINVRKETPTSTHVDTGIHEVEGRVLLRRISSDGYAHSWPRERFPNLYLEPENLFNAKELYGVDASGNSTYVSQAAREEARLLAIQQRGSEVKSDVEVEDTPSGHDSPPLKRARSVMCIRLAHDVRLAPNSVTAVPHARVFCSRDMRNGSTVMAHGNAKLYQDGVMVAHSAHQVSSGKDVKLVLQVTNTTPHTVTYRRGQLVGAIEEVDIMSCKEQEEIEKSTDVYQDILSQVEEKIQETSDDSALRSRHDQALIMQTLSKFTHVFDDRFMGEARQQGEVVQHVINTGFAPPRRAHPYRQSPAMEEIVKKEIDKQLDTGVVVHSNSPWASPIVMVKKKDGTWRMCVDYRGLNALTVPDVYPLPAIDQLLYNMRDAKVFTTMDLQSAYNQIAVAPPDRAKTAFIHRTGLYEYTRMPFGLRNAPSTFQRFMNMIMGTGDAAMQIYVMVYLDDVVIFSSDISEHCVHLHQVLSILSRHGLKLKLSKCEFGRNRIHYLGHVLDADGVHVDPAKVSAVADMPLPTKVLELQSFLGMCGYYRRFIDKYSTIAAPLHNLLRQDVTWKWEQVHSQACQQLKQALVSAPVLVMPDYNKPFIIQTDASGVGIGAVLCQLHEVDGKMVEKPTAYVSRGLKKHEKNYSVTHLELLAVVWSLKQFRHYVLGKKFLLQTDHIALESIRKTKDLSGRMARWILVLQEYEFDVQYRKGKENANADALSRLPVDTVDINVNMVSIRSMSIIDRQLMHEQQLDPTFGPLYQMVLDREEKEEHKGNESNITLSDTGLTQFVLVSHVLHHIHMMNNRTHIDQSILQVCLPESMRADILKEMHDAVFSGHLSTAKTYGRILHRYFWFGMYEDIKNYCESCVVCSRRKTPHRQGNIPMLSPQADRLTQYGSCQCVALDVIGPITMSNGQTSYILTMVDLYTRGGRAAAMRQQKTKNIAEAFLIHWVCIYGFPQTIVSDNGPGFASQVMKAAMRMCGVKIHYTLPYHPESNGACERLNATIINMLSSYTQDTQSGWATYLPFIVFAYNTSIHSITGFSPYRLLYGREAVIGSESWLRSSTHGANESESYPTYLQKIQHDMAMSHQLIEQRVSQAADERNNINEQMRVVSTYNIGDQVYVYWPPRSSKQNKISGKLISPYRGPFTVTHQFNVVSYRVKENGTGKHASVHVSRMKKAVERNRELESNTNDDQHDIIEHKYDADMNTARDHGIHEHTRTQRQQRNEQYQQEQMQQQHDSVSQQEQELEEGEVPPLRVHQ
jgi:hypothetical protein